MAFISYVEWQVIVRVLAALVLGIVLGFQRERKKIIEKSHGVAGLRTHAIVCVGAALIAAAGSILFPSNAVFLAGSIMTGIGFIGAGSIIATQGKIRGLINAASIWVAAAIGLSAGLGLYVSAVITTLIVLFILELRKFEAID